MAALKITESEILDELRAAARSIQLGPDNAATLGELREATGFSLYRMTLALKRLKAQGQLECVRVSREALDGRNATVSGYRVLAKAKARR